MVPEKPEVPPAKLAAWIAAQEGRVDENAETGLQMVAKALQRLVHRETSAICGRAPPGPQPAGPYARRLWTCVEYHWGRFAAEGPLPFEVVVSRLEAGELGHGSQRANLLREVILAQALELGESRAAEMFETEYMPKVRAVARRLGGQRAVDAVENFAAELILPRGGRPPRIAGFQGRTPLASWLRSVVANFWISQTRKRRALNLAAPPEPPLRDGDTATAIDGRPCDELLRPVFADALRPLGTEDRVLIKMLVLDGVAQNDLARALGLHSGTLTRRRQRATAAVLAHIQELLRRHPSARQATNCLELVLAGDDAGLKERLAELLAAGIRGVETIGMEADERA